MEQMFGAAIPYRILMLTDIELLAFAMTLRQDGTWQNFRRVYRDIVELLEEIHDGSVEEEEVLRTLKVALPSRLAVVARQFTKMKLISLIGKSIRSAFGDQVAIPQTLVSGYALAAGVVKGATVYNQSLLVDTKRAIRAAIEKAAPEIVVRQSG